MKELIAALLLLFVCPLNAQNTIDGLVNAEKSFAAYSVAHGAKPAFLKFLDSNGVVFEKGKAVNGMEEWKKKELRTSVLNWWPQYAEIASSNNFGYTTGPWQLRPDAHSDSVVARGRFTTVWHIDASGQWKFLIDLGVGGSPKDLAISQNRIKAKKYSGEASATELLKAEQNFIDACKTGKIKAYELYLSTESILNRNGLQYPATTKKSRKEMIANTPSGVQYSVTGWGIAPSGDLAYVYGNTIINKKPENYLRIWRKEKGGWKIALEVLRY